jgi:hypothetical protein
MPTRFDGFYAARYEGLNDGGTSGLGVVLLKDGRIYGGDSASVFMGEFDDGGRRITARVNIAPLAGEYRAVTGVVDEPWSLPDIQGTVPDGPLPLNCEIRLDGERYFPSHHAVSITLWRIATF